MANFTTENNTYCFRIGPAFLDTNIESKTFYLKPKNYNPLHIIIENIYNRINQYSYKYSLICCEIKSAILRVQSLGKLFHTLTIRTKKEYL